MKQLKNEVILSEDLYILLNLPEFCPVAILAKKEHESQDVFLEDA